MPTIEQARAWYTSEDPVHDFDHILRVYAMAERLARAEGADLEIVHAAALLHDATLHDLSAGQTAGGGSSGSRASHQHASAEFARRILQAEGWPEARIAAVEHCIRSHRFRDDQEQPQTLEAKILFDADKLDAIGAIGAARAIAFAARQGQPAYTPPSERFLRSGELEPGEGHSSYHEYLFKLSKLHDRLHTPSARAIGAQRHRYLSDFYARLQAELRAEL